MLSKETRYILAHSSRGSGACPNVCSACGKWHGGENTCECGELCIQNKDSREAQAPLR